MDRRIIVLIIFITSLLTLSCSKEDRIRHNIAGVWELSSLEYSYYSNGSLDSTNTINNFGYWIMEDNHSTLFNGFIYDQTYCPRGLSYVLAANSLDRFNGSIDWYSDLESNNRFTVWKGDGYIDHYSIYTITKSKKNKITLQYIIQDTIQDQIYYKEILELKRD